MSCGRDVHSFTEDTIFNEIPDVNWLMSQHHDTFMDGVDLLQRFNQRQRYILVISVLQEAGVFDLLCRSCILHCEMLLKRTVKLFKKPFVKGAFISSIVESTFIRVYRGIATRLVQLFGNSALGFSPYPRVFI